MGVVNVTPDSFVGDVRTPTVQGAVERSLRLVAEGATILDIGGESTRPGSTSISLDEELARVMPVLHALMPQLPDGVRVSIDTMKEDVARSAVAEGVHIINDMSSSLGHVAGELRCGYVAAHMLETPATMQQAPTYDDVVIEILTEVTATAKLAREAGAPQVWIDPGIGFGKTIEHNLSLLANVDRFVATGFPVLVGVSRKGFIGRLHTASDTGDRLEASVALAVWSGALGVDVVRVHDVLATTQALIAL
ncbi:UNVERIFIED_CONTAM: hypothetical protein GTU68_001489 [Idotea baltica]|nr:hypothetical protein [Idotea baltica]